MDASNLISNLRLDRQTNNHLADLVSIKELTGKPNDKIDTSYILYALKYEEIIEKYPFLENEPLFVSKNFSMPCYYYNDKALFPIPLYFGIGDNTRIVPNLQFQSFTNSAFTGDNEKDYKTLVNSITRSYEESPYGFCNIYDSTLAFEYFKERIDSIDKEKLFETAMEIYTLFDYGFSSLDIEDFKKIVSSRTESQSRSLANDLAELPTEITVYRGEGGLSSSNGYSYSLDINVALYFAIRYGNSSDTKIIKGKVKKEDIIWFTDDRYEKEIIVFPSSVYDKEELSMYDDLEVEFNKSDVEDNYIRFKNLLGKYPLRKGSGDHDRKHLLRVLYLGLLLAERECPKDIKLTEKDITSLGIALSLHDIGRDNDWEDTKHGKDSYVVARKKLKRYVKGNSFDDTFVNFLMTYHCIDDKLALKDLDTMNLSHKDKEKLLFLFKIIKDADALDRLRFGVRGQLDVNYLRLPNSIRYVNYAYYIIRHCEF